MHLASYSLVLRFTRNQIVQCDPKKGPINSSRQYQASTLLVEVKFESDFSSFQQGFYRGNSSNINKINEVFGWLKLLNGSMLNP